MHDSLVSVFCFHRLFSKRALSNFWREFLVAVACTPYRAKPGNCKEKQVISFFESIWVIWELNQLKIRKWMYFLSYILFWSYLKKRKKKKREKEKNHNYNLLLQLQIQLHFFVRHAAKGLGTKIMLLPYMDDVWGGFTSSWILHSWEFIFLFISVF